MAALDRSRGIPVTVCFVVDSDSQVVGEVVHVAQPRPVATVTAKLVLDTSEFDAALERVKAAIRELNETPLRLRVL